MGKRPEPTTQLSSREGALVVLAYAVLCVICVAVEPFRSVPSLWVLLPNATFLAYFVVRARFRDRAVA